MTVRVLIADDHRLMRDGLRFILGTERDIETVGEASSGRETIEAAREYRPDIVLMDISMPGVGGIEATRAITSELTGTRVVIVSMHATAEHVYQAFRAGATGYLVKEAAGKEVVDAIRAVSGGRRYVSRLIDDAVVEASTGHSTQLPEESPVERLSDRERQVLKLVVAGHTSAAIAKILFLSPKTVETYRSRVMKKLAVSSSAHLVRFAVEHHISEID